MSAPHNPDAQRQDCDMVPGEANTAGKLRGDFEAMAKRRHQHPKPKKEGNFWYVRIWQDVFVGGERTRKRQRIKIAPAKMNQREVMKIADEILRPLNQGLITVGSAVNFKTYVEDEYITSNLPLLASTTQACYRGAIRKHLVPKLGELCLRDLTPRNLKQFFSGMANDRIAYPTIVKTRDAGLRVSELLGLKWRCIHSDSLTVEQRYCRGDWAAPKTEASAAPIAVEPHVLARIHRLKTLKVDVRAGRAVRHYNVVKSDGPDDLVFQCITDGQKPMSDGNILKRFIKPAAEKLGLRANWRCLRTSHATWLVQAGADPKSVQGQMRHTRISTTMDIYAQIVPVAQRRAREKLSAFAKNAAVPLLVQ